MQEAAGEGGVIEEVSCHRLRHPGLHQSMFCLAGGGEGGTEVEEQVVFDYRNGMYFDNRRVAGV